MRILKKLVLGLLVLTLLAGLGAGGWWVATATTRNLAHYEEEYWIPADEWQWVLDHGADPRVQASVRAKLEQHLGQQDSAGAVDPDYGTEAMRRLDAFFAAHPQPEADDAWARLVARTWVKRAWPGAAAWLPGFEADPRVTAALAAELEDLATYQYGWREFPDPLLPLGAALVTELERRQVEASDPLLRSMVSLWLRYGIPEARAWVERHEGPRVTEALVAHLLRISGQNSYRQGPGELERVMSEVARRKPEPTDALVDALCRFGATPATAQAARAYGPALAARVVARRDALTDDWLKGQATKLVGRLGLATPEDVRPLLKTLERWVYQREGSSRTEYRSGSSIDWGRADEATVDRAVEDLAALGPGATPGLAALLHDGQLWVQHVGARALAKADPAAAARALREALGPTGTTQVYELLAALGALPEEQAEVDEALLEAISCPDPGVAQSAVASVQRRIPTERYVPALISHLNLQEEYAVSEVDYYVATLTEGRAGVSPHLARALEGLLQAVGSPDRVPLIHKVVALRAMVKVGDAAAAPTLERYAQDRTSYLSIVVRTEDGREAGRTQEQRAFAELAREALEAARRRPAE